MAIKVLESNQARKHWRDLLDTVLSGDTDVVITRYHKPVATIVAYEDYLSIQDELMKRRSAQRAKREVMSEALATMIASERVLAREWESPEEDEAWADL
ncbi:MAG: type II toxin-antitoxin system Phd/YefM family antitoxin [Chloroflexi bacterium]|nr:type II toxin-antitoxin system Phd/YefM family antitoxin [Chloroflexota bacterium]